MKTLTSLSDLPGPEDREYARVVSALGEVTRLLNERVKELDCVHAISRLFDRREATLEETLQAAVEQIPLAWQHPEVAEACISLRDGLFRTKGFCASQWQHSSPIVVRDEVVGELAVCYREEPPRSAEGPFLAEERNLLDTIAQRLGGFIERRWTLKSLLSYQEDLRQLASAFALSEEHERRRIAEGLHDRIGQNLALVNMRLSAAQQTASASEAAGMIAEAREMLSDIIAETRTLTFELCPPILYELGLAAALDWLAEQSETTYGFAAIVREHGRRFSLPEDVNATLFQAVREILTNVGRHAEATTVDVDVWYERNRIRVVVLDNGKGFDPAHLGSRSRSHRGFGLFSIRERLRLMGGTMQLQSAPGEGTRVCLTVRLRTPMEERGGVP